jgi:hypothetical protein
LQTALEPTSATIVEEDIAVAEPASLARADSR